jgi:hypothetical protein
MDFARGSGGPFDFCNPSSQEKPAHLVAVDSVVVTEQIAGLFDQRGIASRSCWITQAIVGCAVTAKRTTWRRE